MRGWFIGMLAALSIGPTSTAQQPAVPAPAFVTLGTGGGPLARIKRSGPANAVVVGQDVYLFDVGPGTVRQLAAAGLANHRIRAIFLSHHHIDHIGDLAPLIGTRWVLRSGGGLPVYGPTSTARLVAATLKSLAVLESTPITAGPPVAQTALASEAIGHDVPFAAGPRLVYRDEQLRVDAIDVAHFHLDRPVRGSAPRALALRVTVGGRVITYTGDTGPSDRLTQLAQGSDLLVSEVIHLEQTRRMLERTIGDAKTMQAVMAHMEQDHLTPEQIGRTAAAAGVKEVVLTHLVPGSDRESDTEEYLRGVSQHFSGRVRVAADLDRF